HEELAEDEHGGGVDQERQDHAQGRVAEPVGASDLHVQRDHQQLEGDRLYSQHDREQCAAPPPREAGEGIAGGEAESEGGGEHAEGEDQRVRQRAEQVQSRVDVREVLQGPAAGGERSVGELVGLSWNAPTAMNQNGKTKASAQRVSAAYSAMLLRRVPRWEA